MSTTVFLQTFGDTPVLRVLDFLVVHDDFDYSMTDIARHAGVGYATLKLFWPRLEQHRIVRQTRTVGKAKLYTLDHATPAVKQFVALYWSVAKAETSGKTQKGKMRARKTLLT